MGMGISHSTNIMLQIDHIEKHIHLEWRNYTLIYHPLSTEAGIIRENPVNKDANGLSLCAMSWWAMVSIINDRWVRVFPPAPFQCFRIMEDTNARFLKTILHIKCQVIDEKQWEKYKRK